MKEIKINSRFTSINKLLLPAKCVTWFDSVWCALGVQIITAVITCWNADCATSS